MPDHSAVIALPAAVLVFATAVSAAPAGPSTLGLAMTFSMYCAVACSQAPNPRLNVFQIMVSLPGQTGAGTTPW